MIKKLKKDIEKEFGRVVSYSKDCNQLSELIFNKTNRNVSAATLRRFFGLLSSKFQPSKYTLDTLSVFIGYADFESFQRFVNSNLVREKFYWDNVANNAKKISNYTITNIANNSLIDFSKTIEREYINEQLNNFLASDKNITALIAPSGFGKSISLAKWILQLNTENDIKIFAHSSVMLNLFDYKSEQLGNIGLNINNEQSTISYFINNPTEIKGKLVLIIDAIDELFYQPSKLKRFYSELLELSKLKGLQQWLKIVFSVRENTYEYYLQKELSLIKLKNYYPLSSYYSALSNANLPVFTDYEINKLLSTEAKQITFNNLQTQIKEFLRVPINFELFSESLNKPQQIENFSPIKLYKLIFDRQVFKSSFREEKQDIVWKILEMVETGDNDFSINKSELKEVFSIHLKTEGNYYYAYHELLQKNVLIEEHNPSRYGFTNIKVRFKHLTYFYYLSALKLIDKNNGLSKELFNTISRNYVNVDYAVNVISILYQISYQNENIDAIKHIWSIDSELIKSSILRNTIGICLRNKNGITNELINFYAKDKLAIKNLFERFVDINFLCNGYESHIIAYQENQSSLSSRVFSSCLLYFSSFLKIDKQSCNQRFKILNEVEPDETITAYPLGRKLAYTILHHHFILEKPLDIEFNKLEELHRNAYKIDDFKYKEQYLFDVTIGLALLITKQYELMLRYLNLILSFEHTNSLDSYQMFIRNYHQSIIIAFSNYANYHINTTITEQGINNCESFLEKYIDVKDSFQYAIPICLFLVDYHQSNHYKQELYFKKALSIAKGAKYKFFEQYINQSKFASGFSEFG